MTDVSAAAAHCQFGGEGTLMEHFMFTRSRRGPADGNVAPVRLREQMNLVNIVLSSGIDVLSTVLLSRHSQYLPVQPLLVLAASNHVPVYLFSWSCHSVLRLFINLLVNCRIKYVKIIAEDVH